MIRSNGYIIPKQIGFCFLGWQLGDCGEREQVEVYGVVYKRGCVADLSGEMDFPQARFACLPPQWTPSAYGFLMEVWFLVCIKSGGFDDKFVVFETQFE